MMGAKFNQSQIKDIQKNIRLYYLEDGCEIDERFMSEVEEVLMGDREISDVHDIHSLWDVLGLSFHLRNTNPEIEKLYNKVGEVMIKENRGHN